MKTFIRTTLLMILFCGQYANAAEPPQGQMTYLEAIEAAEAKIDKLKGRIAYEPARKKIEDIVKSQASESEKIILLQREFSLFPVAAARPGIALPPGAPSELLLKYVSLGETAYVAEILRQNPRMDVNRPKASGNKTALYLACEEGFFDIVKILLKHNADAGICDNEKNNRFSSLTIAASKGHLKIVEELLKSGVDKDVRDDDDRTALYAAAVNNHPETVKYLCQLNATINYRRNNGWTPLTDAARNGWAEVVKILIENKADLEMPKVGDTGKPTAAYLAAVNNHPETLDVLCQAGAKVNVYGINGWTPLTAAARNGWAEVVDVLIKHKADLNMISNNYTPLEHAVHWNHKDVVYLLCLAGANVNLHAGPFLPLENAAQKENIDIIKVLLEYGADPYKRQNYYSDNAIEWAKKNNRWEIASLLANHRKQNIGDIHDFVTKSMHKTRVWKNVKAFSNKDIQFQTVLQNYQTVRAELQSYFDSRKDVPGDYRNAVLNVVDTQISLLAKLPASKGVSYDQSMQILKEIIAKNKKACDSLNIVCRRYGVRTINTDSGVFD